MAYCLRITVTRHLSRSVQPFKENAIRRVDLARSQLFKRRIFLFLERNECFHAVVQHDSVKFICCVQQQYFFGSDDEAFSLDASMVSTYLVYSAPNVRLLCLSNSIP